jgi:hypothetical protein
LVVEGLATVSIDFPSFQATSEESLLLIRRKLRLQMMINLAQQDFLPLLAIYYLIEVEDSTLLSRHCVGLGIPSAVHDTEHKAW